MKNAKATTSPIKTASFLTRPAAFLGTALSATFRLHETLVQAIEKFALSK